MSSEVVILETAFIRLVNMNSRERIASIKSAEFTPGFWASSLQNTILLFSFIVVLYWYSILRSGFFEAILLFISSTLLIQAEGAKQSRQGFVILYVPLVSSESPEVVLEISSHCLAITFLANLKRLETKAPR